MRGLRKLFKCSVILFMKLGLLNVLVYVTRNSEIRGFIHHEMASGALHKIPLVMIAPVADHDTYIYSRL